MKPDQRVLVAAAPYTLLPTCPEHKVSRREVLRMSFALGALAFVKPACAAGTLTPTPDQIRGPFYPVQKPDDGGADLTRLKGRTGQARGQIIYVNGRVLNLRGEPCPGVQFEVWQANAAGRYRHPRDSNPASLDPNFDGYAKLSTDAAGRYRYRTVKPGAYPVSDDYWRPPHIHYDIRGKADRLVTQMYFDNEPLNQKDPLLQQSWAKDSLIAKTLPPDAEVEPDARLVVWDIVLVQG
ncbi:MAG: protocatechuate 3,4-dioxygenase [Betaproteobacteria bacterium]